MFAGNSEGLIKFISNGLAATLSRQELNSLAGLVTFVDAATRLPFKELTDGLEKQPTSELTTPIPELPIGLPSLVQSMATSGISKNMPGKFFDLIGLEVGGKPGRPPKDYSREYELKKSLSWTKVARNQRRFFISQPRAKHCQRKWLTSMIVLSA